MRATSSSDEPSEAGGRLLRRRPRSAGATWSGGAGEVRVLVTGRGFQGPPDEVLVSAEPNPPPRLGWLRQTHSTRLLEATDGLVGKGDALHTREAGLGLVVQTADCIPVVLWSAERLAVVHAGWRGVRDRILPRTVRDLELAGGHALIGPAIGACCYEVGDDVARAVGRSCGGEDRVVVPREPRPHLDLVLAARLQLAVAGIPEVAALGLCTRCTPELHSYRRDGPKAGRNLMFAWRER